LSPLKKEETLKLYEIALMRNSCKAKSHFRPDLFYAGGEEGWERLPYYSSRCCAYCTSLWWQNNDFAALAEW